ncbi:hypothetical protein [Actinophytocola gossypii]|uniref:Uncharacterized protein n=1 Tax=Actinophytocola gossypii TaxID=2812003 RepID=A0ABT2JK61_9PSEU|nr:hypothetical protein [Actinophytocola gossypii]MCT2588272.1 hypothetical protein [Actinophytocola gossypii]
MTRHQRHLLHRLSELERAVDRISRSIEKIEVATIVREPSSGVAVDAYDGLRRQIVAAAGERIAHLHQLARFAEAVGAERPSAELASLVDEWLVQAGLERVTDPHEHDYFDVLGGTGSRLRVLRPGYRDRVTGRPVVMGQAERVEPAATGGQREGVR